MKSITNCVHDLVTLFYIPGGALILVNSIIHCLTFVNQNYGAVLVRNISARLFWYLLTFLKSSTIMLLLLYQTFNTNLNVKF